MKLPVPPLWWTVSVTAVIASGVLVVGTVRAFQQTEIVTVPGASVTIRPAAGNGHVPAHATAEPSRFLTPPASHGPLPAHIPVYTPSAYYPPPAPATTAVPVTPSRTPAPAPTPTPTASPTATPVPSGFSSGDPIPSDTGFQTGDAGDENVPSSDPGVPGQPWHRLRDRVDYVVPDPGPPGTVNGW